MRQLLRLKASGPLLKRMRQSFAPEHADIAVQGAAFSCCALKKMRPVNIRQTVATKGAQSTTRVAERPIHSVFNWLISLSQAIAACLVHRWSDYTASSLVLSHFTRSGSR